MYNLYSILLVLLLPIISGFILLFRKKENKVFRQVLVFSTLLLTTVLALLVSFTSTGETLSLIKITDHLSISFQIDGLSKIFITLVSLTWLIATVYAFGYMKHEGKENRFFTFFMFSFSVVTGLIFSANIFTLYIFYEFITLLTLPLVMHKMDGKSRYAGKIYLEYMMIGASLAFVGLIFILNFEIQPSFTFGGILDIDKLPISKDLVLGVFLLTALGFGVKAAIFPFHKWLPTASVAPTPVTALLHAVAVVNAGIFAIIRLTYYIFGPEYLKNTWGQTVLIILAAFTIVYGSIKATKTSHIKRRFAYSTISNLSYIILGISTMTTAGLVAGLVHMVFHSILKMGLFFVAGNILFSTEKEYIYEIEGFGFKMKSTFITLIITGLALAGIPPLAGFYSKHLIADAALASSNGVAIVGFVALLVSAFFTLIYVIQLISKAYSSKLRPNVKEVNNYMKLPIQLISIVAVIISIFANQMYIVISSIIGG